MKIAVAPNAFKGSLTASEAAECLARGLRRGLPGCEVVKIPVADGGDGTARAVVDASGGRWVPCRVGDPLGRPVEAGFGLTGDGRTAVVEMALASGLALLRPDERDPMRTTTAGTGELIRAALDSGAERILIGIGGSATNDGGIGMARALGARLLDADGRELEGTGRALARVSRIDLGGLDPRLKRVSVEVACDVTNPLFGPQGAARVYAPQKGATPEAVEALDAGLRHLAAVILRDAGADVASLPGGGAAGGLGAGLVAFLGGRLVPGAEHVLEACGLRGKLAGCDLAVTGEGRLDAQTAFGKAPAAVARVARSLGIPMIAICGSLAADAGALHEIGIVAYFAALEESVPESELAAKGPGMLERCAEEVGRLLALKGLGK